MGPGGFWVKIKVLQANSGGESLGTETLIVEKVTGSLWNRNVKIQDMTNQWRIVTHWIASPPIPIKVISKLLGEEIVSSFLETPYQPFFKKEN